jgi:hypothetical protein
MFNFSPLRLGYDKSKLTPSDMKRPLTAVWHRREAEHARTGRIVDKVRRKAPSGSFVCSDLLLCMRTIKHIYTGNLHS